MSKFKVGDKVKRIKGAFHGMGPGDTGTITNILHRDGKVLGLQLREYPVLCGGSHDDAVFELVQPEPARESDWSYAEAERLQKLAHEAIDAYNEYINAKPNTVFLTIFK